MVIHKALSSVHRSIEIAAVPCGVCLLGVKSPVLDHQNNINYKKS
jgi:hypothetical protein